MSQPRGKLFDDLGGPGTLPPPSRQHVGVRRAVREQAHVLGGGEREAREVLVDDRHLALPLALVQPGSAGRRRP